MSKATRIPSSLDLTDTQRELCLAALQRPDAAILMPARLKGQSAKRTVAALIGKSLVREVRAKADLPVWRQDEGTGHRFSLVLTKSARTLLAAEAAAKVATPLLPESPTAPASNLGDARLPTREDDTQPVRPNAEPQTASPRSGSKLLGVIALLGQDNGTTVADIMAATGWLPHTTRAALTGLRKRGYPVLRQAAADGTGSVYRIGAAAPPAAAPEAAAA